MVEHRVLKCLPRIAALPVRAECIATCALYVLMQISVLGCSIPVPPGHNIPSPAVIPAVATALRQPGIVQGLLAPVFQAARLHGWQKLPEQWLTQALAMLYTISEAQAPVPCLCNDATLFNCVLDVAVDLSASSPIADEQMRTTW